MGTQISIHKALASLDFFISPSFPNALHFNPQGSREPRLGTMAVTLGYRIISIHKALANLDHTLCLNACYFRISIHKALASLDRNKKGP